jgi:hypothetical protein
MPDRDYSDEVHGKHLRILQAAIRDFKLQRHNLSLKGMSLMEFKHLRYSHLQQEYSIPQKLRTGKELMDYSKKDPSVLRQYRCLPINRYYSMLLENAPGYAKNTTISADPKRTASAKRKEQQSEHNKGDQEQQSDQNTSCQEQPSDQNISCQEQPSDQKSSCQEQQSDQRSSVQGLRSDQKEKSLSKRGEPSYHPSHKAMQYRVSKKDVSRPSTTMNVKDSASNQTLHPSNVEHHGGDKWMERRAKH